MGFTKMLGYEPAIGTIILISEKNRSLNNGKDWHLLKTVETISEEESFSGTKSENGPSMSGFWGNGNEIRSGQITKYCRKYNGKRWGKI